MAILLHSPTGDLKKTILVTDFIIFGGVQKQRKAENKKS